MKNFLLTTLSLLYFSLLNAANSIPLTDHTTATPSVIPISELTAEASLELDLFRTASTIKSMNKIDRNKLISRLSIRKEELQKVIPAESQVQAASSSCCLIFWSTCLKVSAKTLGRLALDLILDISDGKLDGKSLFGEVEYGEHLVEIVKNEIDEFYMKEEDTKKRA
ncbi:MAG: hypothetical protein H6492_02810 [Candidatus Paracaedibacteraceae bacterium]|nr:hypothetical protein [Candidatus Paracaedibacteraceae bacterium]